MKRPISWLVLLAALTVGLLAPSAGASSSPPHCVTGARLLENSGNGPSYRNLSFCSFTSTTNQIIVDGSPLQNGAVLFGQHVSRVAVTASPYPNPNGTHWHCQQYANLYSWDCISGYGFNYGGIWAFLTTDYQHPHPATDYVGGEMYYNQNGPNGMAATAQWKHRLIAVNDGQLNELVSPAFWKVSDSNGSPPAPVTCMVASGPRMGQMFKCSAADQRSILDQWHQEAVIPNRIAW